MRLAIICMLALLTLNSGAQAAKRVALVIGNSDYVNANKLANPSNDAEDIAKKLRTLGFEVTFGENLTLDNMRNTVRTYLKTLDGAEIAAFYYAGHGLQVNGTNYIVPVDAKLSSEDDLNFEAMAVDSVLSPMERTNRTNIIILDACRDNPLAQNLARSMGTRSVAVGKGLARLGSGVGTLIAFSTQPGNVALDGTGRNSPFTSALLAHLGTPGQDISKDLVLVRRDVLAATGGQQVPWENSSLTGEVVLNEGPPDAQKPAAEDPAELAYWNSIEKEESATFFETYLARYPAGKFADIARLKIKKLSGAQVARAAPAIVADPTPKDEPVLDGATIFTEPSAQFPFDGYWSLTRIASKSGGKSTCGWPSIQTSLEVKNGKVVSSEWNGKVDRAGNLQLIHTFIDDTNGKKGRNRLIVRMQANDGTGQFNQIGGGCQGIVKMARQ